MAEPELDATRIRELLLDFYAENDPQRLNMGLDIFSMVVWTQQNGLASLNDLLYEQYGAKIDPEKQLGGAQASFKRFSALMNTDSEDDTQKRNMIKRKLVEFYQDRDPSKMGRLNDFVQYIMLHGIDAFNRKLIAKYGEGITLDPKFGSALERERNEATEASRHSLGSSFTISTMESYQTSYNRGNSGSSEEQSEPLKSKSPPALPPKRKKSPPPKMAETRQSWESDELDDIPPPPPPPPAEESDTESLEERLRSKLKDYYLANDPSKLEHVDAILSWGLQIGEEELEGKLMQIYGVGFSSPTPKRSSIREKLRLSTGSKASKASKGSATPKPPARKAAKPSAPAAATKPKPPKKVPKDPIAQVQAQAGVARPNTMTRKTQSPDDGPCSFYELDMTGSGFGVCKCGYSRLAHMKGSPENRKATEKAMHKARALASEMQSNRFHPVKPSGSKPSPGMEPAHTGTYLYMTTSDSKGKPSKVDARAHGGEKDAEQPCNNFRLDMTAGSFSVCECGFKRDQHQDQTKTWASKGLRGSMKRLSKQLFGR